MSSPNIEHYKAVSKEGDHKCFVMYPWTLAELRVWSGLLGRDATADEKAFEICGGSLRQVLGGAMNAFEGLRRAAIEIQPRALAVVFKTFADIAGAPGLVAHRFVHGFPPEDATFLYERARPAFASPVAQAVLAADALQRSADVREQMLRDLSISGSQRGGFFEAFVLTYLTQQGERTLAVLQSTRADNLAGALSLRAGPPLSLVVPQLELQSDAADAVAVAAVAWRQKRPTLVVPRQLTFPAVDSFAVLDVPALGGWAVLALQMTASAEHNYAPQTLEEYRLQLPSGVPFVYCVVCLDKRARVTKLTVAEGAFRASAAARQAVEKHGVWLLPLA